jgi:hypothetical protein
MSKHPMVEALRQEAQRNPVFKDICLMWSQRQRTRGRLTVTRIKQAMDAEGFTSYTRKQYEDVLRFLGKIGLGQLELSKRGKARSLNNVKIKLQSVAQAALNNGTQLENRTLTNRYEDLVPFQNEAPVVAPKATAKTITRSAKKVEPKASTPQVPVRKEEFPVYLTMMIGDKMVNIPAGTKLTPENMGEFIAEFKKLGRDIEL